MKTALFLTTLALPPIAHAALQVVEAPDPNVSPTTQINPMTTDLGAPINVLFTDLTRVDPDTAFFGLFNIGESGVYFFRSTDTPPAPSSAIASSVARYYTNQNGTETYDNGAMQGSDNWLYITKNTDTKAWAQLDFNTTSATVLRYVFDDTNPTADFTLAQALAAVNGPASSERDIQIRSIDFTTNVLELKNFGPSSIDLDGWRFCSHDDNQVRVYTGSSGLNGKSIDSGASLFIHFNNDASGGPNHINASSVGNFAGPLNNGAYGIQLYFAPVSFGNGNSIADHLQWSHGGVDNLSADERSDEAQVGGVWTHQSSWIVTSPRTELIILTDTNNGILHGPDDYLRVPDFQITGIFYNEPSGDVIINFPDVNNLTVAVQKASDLSTDSWETLFSTSDDTAPITGQTDPSAYFRIVPQTP